MVWKRLNAIAAITIIAALPFVAAVAPAYAEKPWTHGGLSVSPGTVCAGETVLISGNAAPPGETLMLTMEPNGIDRADEGTTGSPTPSYILSLGTTKADADGNWTLETAIPLEAPAIMIGLPQGEFVPGEWIVLAENDPIDFFAFNTFTVRDCSGSLLPPVVPPPDQTITPSTTATSTSAGYSTTTLPSTGFHATPVLVMMAGLLAGAGLLKVSKRQGRW